MKKKIWNLGTMTPPPKEKGWWISIQPVSGTIRFSHDLVEKLGLAGKKVNFIQNEEDLCDWYFDVSIDENAMPVKVIRSVSKVVQAHVVRNMGLTKAIFDSCKLTHVTQRIIVGNNKTDDGYAIITKSAKRNTRQKNGATVHP